MHYNSREVTLKQALPFLQLVLSNVLYHNNFSNCVYKVYLPYQDTCISVYNNVYTIYHRAGCSHILLEYVSVKQFSLSTVS